MPEKLLIFRRGSLGDAIVSLPALQAVAERFPNAERRILTNTPVMGKAAPMEEILAGIGLVDGFLTFPPRLRGFRRVRTLRQIIKEWGPDSLAYLSEPSGYVGLLREFLFFRSCGIHQFVGIPFRPRHRRYRRLSDRRWESESARLMRAIGGGDGMPRGWSIQFDDAERDAASAQLTAWGADGRFIAFSIGGKFFDKDWGNDNWSSVLDRLTDRNPDLGIVAIGAENEAQRSQQLLSTWRGPQLNLCGETTPRVSALIMEQAAYYLGHDSGPMHLAGLVGTPCIAVFSARAKPGVWFPQGDQHRIFYPWDEAAAAPERAGSSRMSASILTVDADAVLALAKNS